MSSRAARAFEVVFVCAYPFVMWLALDRLGTRTAGLVGLAFAVPLLAIRLRTSSAAGWRNVANVLLVPSIIFVLLGVGAILDDARVMLMMPVVINVAMLFVFGASLFSAVPMIERFARLQDPDLTPAKQAHCRQFTIAWCVFFLANASGALGLALFGSHATWALFTGLLSYAGMGVMFAVEIMVRRARFGHSTRVLDRTRSESGVA